MFLAPAREMQEYEMAQVKAGFLETEAGMEQTMEEQRQHQFLDFIRKVADDDWGLSHRELVMEARTLLGRTYSPDEDSDQPEADSDQ
jgi:hypothetical protein